MTVFILGLNILITGRYKKRVELFKCKIRGFKELIFFKKKGIKNKNFKSAFNSLRIPRKEKS